MFTGQEDTIVACATPPGRGAISVVRLSGPAAAAIGQALIRKPAPRLEREPRLCICVDKQGDVIDRALFSYQAGPRSYTGEDTVEISCHGSPLSVRRITQACLQNGARLARPGEYTLRAFLRGKLDLAQAEAIRDLIASQTTFQARIASQQLEGSLSRQLRPIKEELIGITAHLETAVEFVEDEVDPDSRRQLQERIQAVDASLRDLMQTFAWGRLLSEGLRAVIIGRPNVGKSTIFNNLVEQDRALVTPTPGTTRDTVTEMIDLEGIPTRVADTAGLRESPEEIERLGIEKSLQYVQDADVLIVVLDRSVPFCEEDQAVASRAQGRPAVLVLNKADLPKKIELPATFPSQFQSIAEVSALRDRRLTSLRRAVFEVAVPKGSLEMEGSPLTSLRQEDCVRRSRSALKGAAKALGMGLSEEFAAYDLKQALNAIGEITGEISSGDILEEIFATFCIGK